MKNQYKLVLIEWEDSVLGFQGWKKINENINTCTRFLSVGFLVHKDKQKTVLYPHIEYSKDNELGGSGDITIPNSAIIKMKVLNS